MIPLITKVFNDYNFSGFVYVSAGENEFFMKNGYADRKKRVEFNRSIKFPLASLTKQFTSFAVLLCHDRGLLNINDKIVKYIPLYPLDIDVTLIDLMGMISGIKDIYTGSETLVFESTGDYWQRNRDIFYRDISTDEVVSLLNEKRFRYVPGSGFQYSNFNYRLLGTVIEQVSGTSLEAFMHENIFAPLEMYDTCLGTEKSEVKSYDRDLFTGDVLNKGADMGVVSTVDDMKKWVDALCQRRLLSEKSYDVFFTPKESGYCCGMWKDKNIYKHDGKLMCINIDMSLNMVNREFMLSFRNCDPIPSNDMRIAYYPIVRSDDGILKLEVWDMKENCEIIVDSVELLDINGRVMYSQDGGIIHVINDDNERNAVDFADESIRSVTFDLKKLLGDAFSTHGSYLLRVCASCGSLAQLGLVYRSNGESTSMYFNIFNSSDMAWQLFCESINSISTLL